jgi:predicted DNA binding protein
VLEGERKNILKYYKYLKSTTYRIESVSSNAFSTLTRVSKNKEYYRLMYNPFVFYSAPIVHKEGKEFVELSCWDKKPLADILLFLKKSRNTEMFRLLSFRQEKNSNVFMIKSMKRLTDKQREVFELAKNLGYYSYPRKANLDHLAKAMKTSKSTVHEILRRAESNIMKQI